MAQSSRLNTKSSLFSTRVNHAWIKVLSVSTLLRRWPWLRSWATSGCWDDGGPSPGGEGQDEPYNEDAQGLLIPVHGVAHPPASLAATVSLMGGARALDAALAPM